MFNFIKQNTQLLKDKVGQTLQEAQQIHKYIDNVQRFIDGDDEDSGYAEPIDLEESKLTKSEKLQIIINKS